MLTLLRFYLAVLMAGFGVTLFESKDF
jgi:hypothetical protein